MKQKQANRPNWTRILEKRYYQEYIQDHDFECDVSYLLLDKVRDSLTVSCGETEVCIVDHGYSWLMFFPKEQQFSLTVMINQYDEVVQFYFDVIESLEYSTDGIPIINDLYLDIVYLPNGQLYLLDEDELEEAYADGIITKKDYMMAKREAVKLHRSIRDKSSFLINNIDTYVKRLRELKELL